LQLAAISRPVDASLAGVSTGNYGYDRSMATTTKIGEPARVGHWGLAVDSLIHSTQYIILQYPDEARRHTEPYVEVRHLPYVDNADQAIPALREAGLPKGIAAKLVFQLEMKRRSPKAADADLGYRPVS
jgi:hypothetical protein